MVPNNTFYVALTKRELPDLPEYEYSSLQEIMRTLKKTIQALLVLLSRTN